MPEILIASTVSVVLENIAVLTMWFGNWYDFYIVQKEVESDDTDVEAEAAGAKVLLNQTIRDDMKQPLLQSDWKTTNITSDGKHNSTINVISEHENRKSFAIQGV